MGHLATTRMAVLWFNPTVLFRRPFRSPPAGFRRPLIGGLSLIMVASCDGRLQPAEQWQAPGELPAVVVGADPDTQPVRIIRSDLDITPNERPTISNMAPANAASGDSTVGAPDEGRDCSSDGSPVRGASFAGLRRLSSAEREGTFRALLGELFDTPEIAERVRGLPADVMITAGDLSERVPAGLALSLSQIATVAAEQGLASPTWRASLDPCAEEAPINDGCAESVVRRFGARVWRRDLTQDEVDEYLEFHADAGGGEAGFAMLIRRLLQSPPLVFHIEATTGEHSSGRLRLTGFEVASRIAYMTTDSMPDDQLLDAARAGELEDVDAIEAHVARLLDSDAGRAKVRDFVRYYGQLGAPVIPAQDVAAFAGVANAADLAEAAQREALAFFDHVMFEQGGTFADLMLRPVGYVLSDELARVFGVEAPDPSVPVATPSHPGWLHRPAILLSAGPRTNPIRRGAHVRKLFLCTELPLPDDTSVIADAQQALLDSDELPNREAVNDATSGAACQGCHGLINPLGFVFEGYDQLGIPRVEEVLLDAEGEVVRTFSVDTAVLDPTIEASGPVSLQDSLELAEAIAHGEAGRSCMTQRFFEYYRRSAVDRELDSCALSDVLSLGREASLREMITKTIANADVYYRADER